MTETGGSEKREFMMTPGQVDGWIIMAKAGDILLYARKQFLPQGCVIGEHVRVLAERKLITFEGQRRYHDDRGLFEYRVRRTEQDPRGATAKPTAVRGPSFNRVGSGERRGVMASGVARTVYDLIADAALAGRRCPSLVAIANELGYASAHSVSPIMTALERGGAFRLETRTAPQSLPQRVAIFPCGMETAGPVVVTQPFGARMAA